MFLLYFSPSSTKLSPMSISDKNGPRAVISCSGSCLSSLCFDMLFATFGLSLRVEDMSMEDHLG